MLFPILPFMVQSWIPHLKDDQTAIGEDMTPLCVMAFQLLSSLAGKYVGFIGGALFFGRMFGRYARLPLSAMKQCTDASIFAATCGG